MPPPAHAITPTRASSRRFGEIVEAEHAFVAEEDDGAVGFALVRLGGPAPRGLTDLYVVPEARRGGVAARSSARRSTRSTRGVEFADLEADAANGVARSVYQHWGFRTTWS